MFKNYFKTAWRNLWKNKIFSLINIIGLSIGISASLVIYLIVAYDFSFDTYHKDGNRIYRVVENFVLPLSGQTHKGAAVPSPLGNAVQNEITGLDVVSPFRKGEPAKVSVPGAAGKLIVFKDQKNIVFANENYFKLFEYTWVAGNPKTSLQQPYQVVLTESNAKLYFPKLSTFDVVGKELYFDDTVRTTITGVVKDITQHTDFNYKTFFSRITLETTSLKPRFWERWDHSQGVSQLFIKLSPHTTTPNIKTQLAALYKKHYTRDPNDPEVRSFDLQPLSGIHFKSDYDSHSPGLADKTVLYGLLAVAAFLLLLACINFINLTTAQAAQRAKEIGIRKTIGSSRKQLISQFLSETFLLTLIATIISAALTPILLKAFAKFIPQGLTFDLFNQPGILIFLLGLVAAVSLLSGIYPAIVLSSYKPILVLKGQAYTGKTSAVWLRKGLTVSQFVIAQVFVIATLLVSKQINYTLSKDMGFKKNAVIYFGNYTDTSSAKKKLLMNKLNAIPGVAMASLSMDPPASQSTWIGKMKYQDGKKEIETDVQVKIGDTNYIKLYQIKLLAGTNLSQSDTMNSLLINETYAHILGFTDPQQAIGKYIDCYGKKPVVGVIQDFNQTSLHEAITPLLITTEINSERTFNIALQPQNAEGTAWQTAISQMQKAWKEVYPEKDFDYAFLDESIAEYYTAEQNINTLMAWSSGLTIFISCLGLLGLVIYITNQRTKEIGIRKVVGATVVQLVSLLSKDFLKLVILAFIIAIPIAWWGAHIWLQGFAYKTALSWWVFLAGGIIMLLLALIILGLRTFKSANANPVKSLRTE